MTTAVAPRAQQSVAIKTDEQLRDFLTERQGEFAVIAKASGVGPEVLVAELVVAARKNPDILSCTQESIVNFMYDSAKTGLIIGRGCFAVPVNKKGAGKQLECWIGAHGMRELVIYGKAARDAYAQVVFDGDPFEEILGLYPDIKHQKGPNYGNMDRAIGVYGVLVISQSVRRHVYLTKADIERLRKLNKSDTTSAYSPWVAHTKAMWEAKAVLAICKDAPRNARLAAAMSVFERNESVVVADLETVHAEVVVSEPSKTSAVTATAKVTETGEAATDAQVALIKQLAQSHHFDVKGRATMNRKADAATKAQAATMIDGATDYIRRMDAQERANKAPEPNPVGSVAETEDDLPF